MPDEIGAKHTRETVGKDAADRTHDPLSNLNANVLKRERGGGEELTRDLQPRIKAEHIVPQADGMLKSRNHEPGTSC